MYKSQKPKNLFCIKCLLWKLSLVTMRTQYLNEVWSCPLTKGMQKMLVFLVFQKLYFTSIWIVAWVFLNCVEWQNLVKSESLKTDNRKKSVSVIFLFSSKVTVSQSKQQTYSWTTGSGRMTRPKNFKTSFFSRYQKFFSWANLNGSRTTPKFFYIFFQQIWSLEEFKVFAY